MGGQELIPHLFRTEYSKITAVLCKYLGFDQLEIAEDIASEAFVKAMETWPYHGIPPNPTAWLYTVAKNKARNYIRRNETFIGKVAPELSKSPIDAQEIDLSNQNIYDSQLRMMFAVCHPSISKEAQIGLALRVLCGFGIDEIATALMSNPETINKRLYRAKEKLRDEKIQLEIPNEAEIKNRLEVVLTTLYLLFSEGYYSESHSEVIRKDLCLEAMRLTHLLLDNSTTNFPVVNAFMALMCFHVSRFEARKNEFGQMILYQDQDDSLWNQELISKGAHYLRNASQGQYLSKYHLEASIAYWYTIKSDPKDKWENILQLYDHLLKIDRSPIVALNRIYALSQVKGKPTAIAEAEKLNQVSNQYYFALLGELYTDIDNTEAKKNFQMAHDLARTKTDKHLINNKLLALKEN